MYSKVNQEFYGDKLVMKRVTGIESMSKKLQCMIKNELDVVENN